MKRGEILDAVKRTITQDRNNRHGEPENSFPMIAQKWTDYLRRCGYDQRNDLKPSDVAEMMALFKDCRFQMQPENPDNKHDQIGYLAIAGELRESELNSKFQSINSSKIVCQELNLADRIAPQQYRWQVITSSEYDDLLMSEQIDYLVDEIYTTERFPVAGQHQLLTVINQTTGKVMRYVSVADHQQRPLP